MAKFREWAILGLWAGALIPLVLGLVKKFLTGVTVMFAAVPNVEVTPGIPTGIADFFLSSISLPFSLPAILVGAVGGALFVGLGGVLHDNVAFLRRGRKPFTKVFLVLLYSSVVLAGISTITGTGASFFPVLLTSSISSAVTALVIVGLSMATRNKLVKIPS